MPPRLLISFTRDKADFVWKGYMYAAMLFTVAFVQSMILHQYFHRCFVIGLRIRTAIIASVYRKVDRGEAEGGGGMRGEAGGCGGRRGGGG